MPTRNNYVRVPGSERSPMPGATLAAAANSNEQMEVTVMVRPKQPLANAAMQANGGEQSYSSQPMSHEEYVAAHGAQPDDLAAVEKFAKAHNLTATEASEAKRSVTLRGSVADFSAAFDVELHQYNYPEGSYRGRTGAVHIPSELSDIIQGVFGLDDRPVAKPHCHFTMQEQAAAALAGGGGLSVNPAVTTTQAGPFTPVQLSKIYDFPANATGIGQTIALIELGGGIVTSDLVPYFAQIGVPLPSISTVLVDGGTNTPSRTDGPKRNGNLTFEVMLDVEVAGGVAPGAKIVVYFSPNTTRGFIDCINTAVTDRTNHPSVISISWGGPESSWTPSAMQAMDLVFQTAATLGITVCTASGDNGSSDGVADNAPHADFPSSSPNVLACGGTTLEVTTINGKQFPVEKVWNSGLGAISGGGFSTVFDKPVYQAKANLSGSTSTLPNGGRGVPDVAGHADSYVCRFFGNTVSGGGTSAVAPLWAGLAALLNEAALTRSGFLNPLLYQRSGTTRDVINGSNGAFTARVGWDACTGLGSPVGSVIRKLLQPFELVAIADVNFADASFAVSQFDTDRAPDLFAFRRDSTGARPLNVQVFSGASMLQTSVLHNDTALSGADALKSIFLAGPFNNDRVADVYCINFAKAGSDSLELVILDGARNYQNILLRTPIPIKKADASNFIFSLGDYGESQMDGISDLFCLKVRNNASGSMEAHILNGATNYQTFFDHIPTFLAEDLVPENIRGLGVGTFHPQTRPDIYLLRTGLTPTTGNPALELFILDGASKYHNPPSRTTTPIPPAEAAGYRFATGDFDQTGIQQIYCIRQGRGAGRTTKTEVLVLRVN